MGIGSFPAGGMTNAMRRNRVEGNRLPSPSLKSRMAGSGLRSVNRPTKMLEWISASIANEADPAERQRLIREVYESGLAATQRGQEFAREVLKAAGQRPEIADVRGAQG
jgi:hypothetical protein